MLSTRAAFVLWLGFLAGCAGNPTAEDGGAAGGSVSAGGGEQGGGIAGEGGGSAGGGSAGGGVAGGAGGAAGGAPGGGTAQDGGDNTAPVLGALSAVSLNEGAVSTVVLSATDAEGDPLSFSLVSAPPFVTLMNATVTIAPGFSDSGSYTVQVKASDGQLEASGSFALTVVNVNRAPSLMAISDVTMVAGTMQTVTLSAVDPDGDQVTFSAMNLPAWAMLNNGAISLSPPSNVVDVRTVSVMASDVAGASDSKLFVLTVNAPANQAPVVSMLQQVNDMGTAVAPGATVSTAPKFRAFVDDPENALVRIEVELVDVASGFTNTATVSGILSNEGTLELSSTSLKAATYKWQLRAFDASGAASAWQSFNGGQAAFTVQAGPISGSVVINTNQPATNNGDVSLTLTAMASGGATLTQMCFSNDNVSFSGCAAPVSQKSWTLATGEGVRTVYVKLTDSNGTSAVFSDSIIFDKTPPQVSGFAINSQAAAVTVVGVQLSWVANDALSGVAGQTASNDGTTFTAITGSPAAWSLSAGQGEKTVSLSVTDAAGNVTTVTDKIVLDSVEPTISAVTINGGKAWSNQNANVPLQVTAADGAAGSGVTQICVSGGANAGCQPFGNGSVVINLTAGDGQKAVLVTVRDAANNQSLPSMANVGVDTVSPTLSSVVVNGNAVATNNAQVTVASVANDNAIGSGLAFIQCRTDVGAFAAAVAYAATVQYAMSGGNGSHVVSCKVFDAAGNESVTAGDSVTLDTQPPTGTVTINAGNPTYTNVADVTLVLFASDATAVNEYCVNGTGAVPSGPNDACWKPIANTAYTLAGPDGLKTLSVFFKDAAGNFNVTPVTDAITLDVTPPTASVSGPSLGLRFGASFANTLTVSFNNLASDATSSLSQVCLGAMNPPTGCGPYSSAPMVDLAPGDGPKTMYLRVIDGAGNPSAVVSDTITVDMTAPVITAVVINAGAAYTNNRDLSVGTTATDNNTISQIQFSEDGTTFSALTGYANPKVYTVSAGDGPKTVHVRVGDSAGNTSTAANDTITLDQTPPAASLSVNGGARYTSNATVSVAISPVEAGSGVYRQCVKEAAVGAAAPAAPLANDACFVTFATPAMLTLTAQGDRRVYVWLSDNAGNISSAPATYDIWLDSVAPAAPTGLGVVAGHRSLTFTFNNATDASGVQGYEVGTSLISGSGYSFGSIVAPQNGATTTTVLTLPNGVTEYVVVRTVDMAGNRSVNSAQVSGLPRYPFSHQARLPTANHLNAIAFSASATGYFVAGTDGALYATDSTLSTFTRRDPMTDRNLNDLMVDSGGAVYVVGQQGHIARSTNDGLTFELLTNTDAAAPKADLNDITYAGSSGMAPLVSNYFVAVGNGGTIVRGSTGFLVNTPAFSPVSSGTNAELNAVARCSSSAGACVGGQVLIAVGASGTILRSTDSGATWAAITPPAGYATATFTSVVALPDLNTFFIGAVNPGANGPLLRSINGGLSFSEVSTPSFADFSVISGLDAVGTDLWLAGTLSNLTAVAKLNNTTRTNQTVTANALLPRAIVARSATEIAFAGDFGRIDRTTAQPAWVERSSGNIGSVNAVHMPATLSNSLWQVGQSGWVAGTLNGGANWSQQAAGLTTASLNSIATIDTNGSSSGVMAFAVGSSGTIIKTTNGGTNWALDADTGITTQALNGVSCRTATACFAVGNVGTLLRYDGSNWVTVTTGSGSDLNAVTTYVSSGGAIRAVAVGDTGALRTLNGATWSTQAAISTANFNAVAPKSDFAGIVIAVGTAGSIYKSTDHGVTFTQRTSGIATVLRSVINVPGTAVWYAVGQTHTALKSTDDGETWVPLTTNFTHSFYGAAAGSITTRAWLVGDRGSTLFTSVVGQ